MWFVFVALQRAQWLLLTPSRPSSPSDLRTPLRLHLARTAVAETGEVSTPSPLGIVLATEPTDDAPPPSCATRVR